MTKIRRTYKAQLEFLCQLDDETLSEATRLLQENINEMFYKMSRDDIRVTLQLGFIVTEVE